MKRISRITFIALGVALLAAVVFHATGRLKVWAALIPGTVPGPQVDLLCVAPAGGKTCHAWQSINPNGSMTSYSLPAGLTILVTDVEFSASGLYYGDTAQVGLIGSGSIHPMLFASAPSDYFGNAIGQIHLTTGVPMLTLPVVESPVEGTTTWIQGLLGPEPTLQ